ncbi:2'-5' RNA ligase family protein [Lacisediminihabitans profunda]|uniref:2'-5' RNA ligase family protein n=1 Tax=Lacisediminihabitans profunda TaxID=2594790 RepID=A0A5C8UND0_9MICO|nr:2'-5' RNA ligase family protein [Lacisediminihabitans profunda]TXN29905.1 2'-5' RNA ligase family protein [Lacisediminihabitans profunda]
MPRLVVVLPLVPLLVGESFALQDWPLHITVLPPFLTDASPEQIADAFAAATSGLPAITAIAGRDELFGRRQNVLVTVVEHNEALARLHRTLVAAVLPFAAAPDEPAFTGPGFRPHVTVKPHGRVREGEVLSLSQVALVDMAPRAAPQGRLVLATRPLGDL